jgi:hypothetical protein
VLRAREGDERRGGGEAGEKHRHHLVRSEASFFIRCRWEPFSSLASSSKGQFAVRTLTKTKERRRRRVVVSRAVAAGMRLEDAAAPMA